MKPNAAQYLSLAKKAGRLKLERNRWAAAARAGKARLVILAGDAPDNTRRRAAAFVAGTGQILVTVPLTKAELGSALGRTVVAMAAFTDAALALAFLQALEDPAQYGSAMTEMENQAARLRQRQKEARAHRQNLRRGGKQSAKSGQTRQRKTNDGGAKS